MSMRVRVLLAEDNENDALLILRELKRGGYVVEHSRVDNATDFRRNLREGAWDAVISDYSMPQFDALGALTELKRSGLDLPFIILSGTVGEDVAVAALKAGAHDFIPKHNLQRFLPALDRELREARKRAAHRSVEQELRINQEMTAAIFAVAPLPMALLDPGGRVVRWNTAAERLLGWSTKEVVGKPLPFVSPEAQPEHNELLQRLLSKESITNHEVERVRKDGSPIRMLLSGAPILDNFGNVLMIVGIINDVTEQRALEARFLQSQKMEAIGRLAGGIAHDFNNVLTAIKGYASLLIEELPPETTMRADVGEILQAAERASSFTRQLLAFSRKQVVQPRVVEINSLMDELTSMLERMIGKDVHLRIQLSDDQHHVLADKSQLEQVLINLVVNARDALGGSGEITVGTRRVQLDLVDAKQENIEPGDYCTIAVHDSGVGIPENVLPYIFEPFFSTKEIGKGTGLGLSTVYGIVQQNNGFIRVRSGPGRGTTFSVHLPRVEPELKDVVSTMTAVTSSVTHRAAASVLVVEDEAAIRQVVARILERAGYSVAIADDSMHALDMIQARNFDLLLTDLSMPLMGGQELARAARQRQPHLAVVFMSGYAEEEFSVDDGIPYIDKPFKPEELLEKLAESLSKR